MQLSIAIDSCDLCEGLKWDVQVLIQSGYGWSMVLNAEWHEGQFVSNSDESGVASSVWRSALDTRHPNELSPATWKWDISMTHSHWSSDWIVSASSEITQENSLDGAMREVVLFGRISKAESTRTSCIP